MRCIGTFFIFPLTFDNIHSLSPSPRKRLGKSSFIQKHDSGKRPSQNILTTNELIALATKYKNRVPGSTQYRKAWNNWCTKAIDAIRYELSENLPLAADKEAFEILFYQLGVAADEGIMPPFSHAGARAAYALEFFSRARGLGDLFCEAHGTFYPLPEFWKQHIQNSPILGKEVQSSQYNITSIGGGPGFDFVGAALAATFHSDESSTIIQTTVLDYEEGWNDLVESMYTSTSEVLGTSKLCCTWGGKCDITKDIFHPDNNPCQILVSTTDLFICQFCIAENAKLLKSTKFVFFRDLFQGAKVGSMFVFTEITPRIWPDLYRVITMENLDMQVSFVKRGRIMMLYKRGDGYDDQSAKLCHQRNIISDADLELMLEFERIEQSHMKTVSRQRQHRNLSL